MTDHTAVTECQHCARLLYRVPAKCPDCGLQEPDAFAELRAELVRARAKFPRNRFLLAALTEECGELAQAILQGASFGQIRAEAIQCATVAIRIAEEGDSAFDDLTAAEMQP